MVISIVLLGINELQLQYGAYVIMLGIIFTFITQIIPLSNFILLNISKAGFVLAVLGFFMPVFFNLNIFQMFQINKYLKTYEINNIHINNFIFLLCIIFFISCIGVLLLFFQISKKKINFGIDFSLFFILGFTLVIFISEIMNFYLKSTDIQLFLSVLGFVESLNTIFSNNNLNFLSIGAYFIIIGLVISIIFDLTALFKADKS